jgi:hypothetical protein
MSRSGNSLQTKRCSESRSAHRAAFVRNPGFVCGYLFEINQHGWIKKQVIATTNHENRPENYCFEPIFLNKQTGVIKWEKIEGNRI